MFDHEISLTAVLLCYFVDNAIRPPPLLLLELSFTGLSVLWLFRISVVLTDLQILLMQQIRDVFLPFNEGTFIIITVYSIEGQNN
jgi:hypothetical protein